MLIYSVSVKPANEFLEEGAKSITFISWFVDAVNKMSRSRCARAQYSMNDYIVYYEIIVLSTKIAIVVFMKKEVVITARITPEIKDIVQSLADKDERTLAWMVRKLLLEALETRGLLKKQKHVK
jgi:hypothetical protein